MLQNSTPLLHQPPSQPGWTGLSWYFGSSTFVNPFYFFYFYRYYCSFCYFNFFFKIYSLCLNNFSLTSIPCFHQENDKQFFGISVIHMLAEHNETWLAAQSPVVVKLLSVWASNSYHERHQNIVGVKGGVCLQDSGRIFT